MGILRVIRRVLTALGHQGTGAIAASIAVGLAVPPLAAALKPLFTLAIFLLLVCSFLRVDPAELRARFASPGKVAAASAWMMIVTPLLFGLALPFAGLGGASSGIALGVIMYVAAPPIMSAAAFAILLRLDAALTLALLIVCTAVTPLLAPLFVSYFAGNLIDLDFGQLVLRLFVILGGAYAAAALLRRFMGPAKIAAEKSIIDGVNVLVLILFGIAAMDGVTVRAIREPGLILGLTALVFAIAIGLYALTVLLFWREDMEKSLAIGFSAAHRNMGVMVAAGGSAIPELTWIYFAVAQFPIYLIPMLATPVVHRLLERRLPGGD